MKGKRILSFILAFVMVLGMIPFNALEVYAAEVTDPTTAVVGDTTKTKTETAPADAPYGIWVLQESTTENPNPVLSCTTSEHTHESGCSYLGCDHYQRTLTGQPVHDKNSCYGESTTEWEVCPGGEHAHTAKESGYSVYTNSELQSVWQPIYDAAYAAYIAEHGDTRWNRIAATTEAIEAVKNTTFCYTTTAPLTCGHGDACTSECCSTEYHTHEIANGCYDYIWVLAVDENDNNVHDSEDAKHTVTWIDEDGTQLAQKTDVLTLTVPTTDVVPTKASSTEKDYTFAGWEVVSGEVDGNGKISSDVTYKATYTESARKYTVTWVNWDGTVVHTEDVAYGTTPIAPADPSREADEKYTYTFAGWTPAVGAVDGAKTYTATYTSTPKSYTITWNVDGEVYHEETVAYGAAIVAPADPVKEGYSFSWAEAIPATMPAHDLTFTGVWTAGAYKVTWIVDGAQTSETYSFGDEIVAPADPVKEGHKFTGWTGYTAGMTMPAENVTFTATFEKLSYKVNWVVNGVTTTETYDYGSIINMPEDPTKEGYIFSGWDPEVEATMGAADVTYTATWSKEVYIITFLNDDGNLIDRVNAAYGDIPVAPTATKASTAEYDYVFAGWSPALEAATGSKTYTATYTPVKRSYTITWNVLNESKTTTVEYGTVPTAPEFDLPANHEFVKWDTTPVAVTGTATYTAVLTLTAEDGNIKVNGHSGDTKALDLKKAILDATFGEGNYNIDDYDVYMETSFTVENVPLVGTLSIPGAYYNVEGDVYRFNFLGERSFDISAELIASTIEIGKNESIKIVNKTTQVEKELTIGVEDSRLPAIIGDLTYTTKSYDTVDDFKADLYNYVTVTQADGTTVITDGITIEVNGTTVTVKVSDGENWLAASRTFENVSWTVNQYTVTFTDYDGIVLQSGKWDNGSTPVYTGATPSKTATAKYTYTWIGTWNGGAIAAVNGADVIYTATDDDFGATVNKYTVTWVDGDGKTLYTEKVEYDATPVYDESKGGKPTKTSNDPEVVWTWDTGWTPKVVAVTDQVTYTATFTQDKIFIVTFVDEKNGTTTYGYVNVTKGETTLASVADPADVAGFIFDAWYADGVEFDENTVVTGNITVTADWIEDKNDNNVLDENETATITVTITGEGAVTLTKVNDTDKVDISNDGNVWTVIYDSSVNGTSTVKVNAVPAETGLESQKNYVVSASETVNAATENALSVEFALHTIPAVDEPEMLVNGHTDEKVSSVTKKAVLEAVLGKTLTDAEVEQYEVKMYVNLGSYPIIGEIKGYHDIWALTERDLGSTINAAIKSALVKAIDVGGTESFEITWNEHTADGVTYPAVTERFDVKLTESRQPTTVTHNGTIYIATELSDALMEEIKADLTANVIISTVEWVNSAQALVRGTRNDVSVKVTVLETNEFYGTEHTVTVQVDVPTGDITAVIPESAELVFNTGMTGTDKVALLLEKVPYTCYVTGFDIIAGDVTVTKVTVQYLASTAREVPYTINVAQLDLGVAGSFLPDTVEVSIPVDELWWDMATSGADIPVYEAPSNEVIRDILLNDLIPNYAADYMAGNISEEQLKQIAADLLAKNPDIANYYKFMGAHQFGENLQETVRYIITTTEYGQKTTNECVLSMVDNRAETTIQLNEGVAVTYNDYTEEELMALILDGVYANGQKVEGAEVVFVTDVIGLPAADASEVTVKFAGDEDNKPSQATVAIKINKAAVDVVVDNRLIKWYEGISYDIPVSTNPAGVDTINFIVGLDISDVNINDGIKGIMGNVQLLLPEELQSLLVSADALLQAAGLDISFANGASMKLSELQAAVEALDDIFAGTDYEEYFRILLKMLQSLPTDVADIQITIGGDMPTNVGAYLVGAVSADANYTTDMGVGIVVITPDGIKAELAWNQNDDNYIVTNTLLTTKGADGKYLFDTAAHATSVGEGGNLADATEQIAEVFLGVDIDGNITLETDQTKLNVGAYVEVAMVVNWGNQMYYSEPIARPIVVVAETLDVDFVDETGAVNNERHYEFFNVPQDGMEGNLLVTYKQDGEGYQAGDVVDPELYNVKYVYVGVQTNAVPYASTTAPTHAGAYTITAIVTIRDNTGYITHAGQGIGALVIEPSKSNTTVDNAAYPYAEGTEHHVNGLVHATSVNVPALTPDTTVISAGISADLDNVTGLESINGTVNVDLPSWLDKVLNKLNVLEAGYADGISAETFISYVEKIKSGMSELGFDTAAFDEIANVIEQLPINTNLTFHDDIGYTEVGAYLVIGIVTDSDHYPSAGAGVMVIYPDATKVDLKFNKTWDDNNIFTWQYLQAYDLNAKAYHLGTENENADATAYVKNLYVGFADHGELILTANKADLDNGLYTQVAFVLDISNTPYYAEPISRMFLIVPNPATVEFLDENGNVNNERHFVFDNTQHAMENIRVTTADGTVMVNPEGIDIFYAGVQTNGIPYASEEAPVHAGVYEVTAQYTSRDDQDRVVNLGVAVGAMVIEPAKAQIDVENRAEEYEQNKKHDTESMITVTSDVDVTIDKTVITVMLNTDGTFSETGLNAIQGAVNMDLPQWLDDVMANYDIFTDGLTVSEFVAGVERIKAELADLGINVEILERLVDVANQFPADAEITFHDQADVAPTAVGAYLVIGVVTDSNFYPAMDAGLLVIYPAVVEAQLSWIYEDVNNNNIYTEDTLDIVDLGAQADTEEDISELIKTLFIGVDVENWKIALVDSQDELNIGAYEEFAFVAPNVNSVIYYAKPISRPVIVVANVYNVSIHDKLVTHVFDNTGKDMGEITVTTASGEAVDVANGTLTVTYVGVDTQLRTYYTTEKPVHAGAYTVIATYVGTDADGDQAVGVGIGQLVIEPADADIHVESHAVLYGQDYDFVIETFHDAINDEPKTLTIMAGVDLSAYTTEGKIGIDGTVNVDFPEPIDNVLKELFPELYVNGIGTDAFFAKYDEMVAEIEARGYTADHLKQLRAMLAKLNAVNLTFNETVKPTETGLYAVVAMIFDPDYKYAVDTALIAIAPNATVAELDFNAKIPSLLGMDLLPYEQVDEFDFGAHVGTLLTTDNSLNADSIVINDVIFGLTTGLDLFIGSSEDKPSDMGIYDQIAYVPATENALMAVLPIHRDFLITDSSANVVYIDPNGNVNWLREFIYNGEPQDMGASMMLSDGTVLTKTPSVWYLGIDEANGNVFYSSDVAPTNVGLYQVIGYHFDTTENIYTIGLGAMKINPREVTVNVDDKTMTVGEALPELTYTVENEVASDPLKVTVTTEADGTVAGTFDITATVEENPNYKVTVNNGTLTVEEQEVINQIIDTGRTLSLIGEVFINQYVKVIGFEGIDIEANGGLLIWDHEVDETNALFGTESELKSGLVAEGNEFCQQTSGFAAAEYADQVWLRVYIRLDDGSYVYGPLKQFSVREYCETIIATRADGNSLKNTCIALLHYGTAAQEYFDYNMEDLANKNIVAEYPVVEMEPEWINGLDSFTTDIVDNSDVAHTGKTLSLDSATLINYYYTFAGTADTAELLFWDGVTDELTLNNVTYKKTLVYNANADEYHAQSDIYPGALYGKTIFACAHFVDENGVHHYSDVVAFSPEEYARVRMSTSKNAELVEVLKRMVTFGEYARIYFNK